MALIGTIRKNSWILIVMIGLGLGGFILMDMTSGQQSVFGGSQMVMGSIDGEDINWNRFNQVENMLYRGSSADVFSRRTSLWNYFVEESIIKQEADALGLGVSVRELKDLEFGANPSPIIRQRFMDPTTGQVNREQLNNFKTQIESNQFTDPNLRSFWAHQEQEIVKDQLQTKLNTLISKSLYTPTWMAMMGNEEFNNRIDFAYVKVPFDEIPNTEIALSDSDYEAFIAENPIRFNVDEETRRVAYVSFDVVPTAADSQDIKQAVIDLIPEFESAEDDSSFVERKLGFITGQYLTKEEITTRPLRFNPNVPQQGQPMLTNQSAVDSITRKFSGQTYGPFIDGGNFKLVKVLDKRMIADSADTRHILINATTPAEMVTASNRIDSLKGLLLAGTASWDSLALKFSQDPGSSNNGGKYESVTPNQFVPEFNEVLFVTGEIGELYKIKTQFGYHLVEVLSRNRNQTERYQLALIEQPIVASDDTQGEIFDRVQTFVIQNSTIDALRSSVAEDPALNIELSSGLKNNDFAIGADLPPNQSSRDIVRWAFQNGVGDVSPEIYEYQDPVNFTISKYVVAGLEEVIKPGLPTVDAIRDDVELEVVNMKKGDLIGDQMRSKSLENIATEFDVLVDTVRSITFNQSFVQNLGNEPKIIAKAFAMQANQTSEPIVGNTGVFVLLPLGTPIASSTDPNIPQLQQRMSGTIRSTVSTPID